ncbi:MAG TPA: helix-turn-helix transcriptional regulator [Candidatus Limnocylindrales bacterium]|nr:helix-turn-helix transcriptional regulator [Candidatus Limnocylindrales bacterium]
MALIWQSTLAFVQTLDNTAHLCGYCTLAQQCWFGKGKDMDGASRRITELRERLGLSQGRLAAAAGLSREQLNRIERGSRTLTHAEAVSLALALGVGIDELSTPTEAVQFRGNTDTHDAGAAIAAFRTYVRNWQMIDALRSIDEESA